MRPKPVESVAVTGDPHRAGGHVAAIRASYEAFGPRTSPRQTFETGSLRLRHPRGAQCRGVLVNTAGGIVGGDRLRIDVALGPGADVMMTSSAAEKVYRSAGAISSLETRLRLAAGSRCTWIPHETILFDRARFHRRVDIDLEDGTSSLFVADITAFGRTAHGERDVTGSFRDGWRLRRNGRLVYADMTGLEGEIGAALDQNAVAAGARAMAAILIAGPDVAQRLDLVRAAIAQAGTPPGRSFEGAATCREGIIIARLLADSPGRLRAVVAAMLDAVGRGPAPRDWM